MEELRQMAWPVCLITLGLGSLFFLAGWNLMSLLMLGTSVVMYRISDERRQVVSKRQLDEIERFANDKDDR